MPRLFVGVDMPEHLQQAMVTLCRGLPGVRWLPPEHLHLTLRFIGEVDEALAALIAEWLPAGAFAAFACRLAGVGCFPPQGRPRVIYVAVEAEAGLIRLQAAVEEGLRQLGLAPELRPFVPHITLARLKDGQMGQVRGYLARHAQFQTRAFTVSSYHLYRSRLTPQGAIHSRQRSYLLA